MLKVLDVAARDLGRLSFTLLILAFCLALDLSLRSTFWVFFIWWSIQALVVMDLVFRGPRSFFYERKPESRLKRYAGRKL